MAQNIYNTLANIQQSMNSINDRLIRLEKRIDTTDASGSDATQDSTSAAVALPSDFKDIRDLKVAIRNVLEEQKNIKTSMSASKDQRLKENIVSIEAALMHKNEQFIIRYVKEKWDILIQKFTSIMDERLNVFVNMLSSITNDLKNHPNGVVINEAPVVVAPAPQESFDMTIIDNLKLDLTLEFQKLIQSYELNIDQLKTQFTSIDEKLNEYITNQQKQAENDAAAAVAAQTETILKNLPVPVIPPPKTPAATTSRRTRRSTATPVASPLPVESVPAAVLTTPFENV